MTRESSHVMERGAVVLLVALLVLRLVGRTPLDASAAPGPVMTLPDVIGDAAGERVPLSAVERRLASAPHVQIQRRSYGPTHVSLVTVDRGVREHHPPAVCLSASGFEVISREQRQTAAGCVVELRVREREARRSETARTIQLFTYTYVSADPTRPHVTCDLWRRVGSAVWSRLIGRPARWATIQVLDSNPRRARRVIQALLTDRAPRAHRRDP